MLRDEAFCIRSVQINLANIENRDRLKLNLFLHIVIHSNRFLNSEITDKIRLRQLCNFAALKNRLLEYARKDGGEIEQHQLLTIPL